MILDVLRDLLPSLQNLHDASGRVERVGGGSISDAWHVWLPSGQQLFVKSNTESFLPNFQAEKRGLAALHDATQGNDDLIVARPLVVAAARSRAWLVMDWISSAGSTSDFFDRFGRGLAKLHRATLKRTEDEKRNGWIADNFLGAANQSNPPMESWSAFVAEHRIGYQIRWAVDQGLADKTLIRSCESIANRMDSLLGGRENSTSLLHGDLWSGNYLASSGGAAVIIDPAVYYGCREAEFGMLKLFGGCPDNFYRTYDDEFPFADGWQKRVSVYVLYHLLNHLNLFGRGYLSQCKATATGILS